MQIHEFELRYRAYQGLKFRLWLDWDQDMIMNLVQITDKWIPNDKIQKLSTEELHKITIQTYSNFKNNFLLKAKEKKIDNENSTFTLKEYIERLEYELKVIKEMWFNSYFLIVADFIGRAKQNKIIVWPWRGSWAGSILARLIQITDINPLPFWLLFERFLNPARVSMPDFDVDFEDELREDVIKYVTKKYWYEKVCAIGTYMKMATKAAFKDAARTIGIPFDRSNYVTNMIPESIKLNAINDAPETPDELKSLIDSDEQIEKAMKFWAKLEWNLRQLWVHACWVIIAPKNISSYSATQYIKDNSELWLVSQFDWPTLESLWLLKMDFLWLRNLSVIKNCIRIITKRYEKEKKELPLIFQEFRDTAEFHPPLNEKHTFEKVFQIANTTGIFQFESTWMRKNLIALEADSINDLVAMNALYRPWPMEFIPNYIERKHWREKIIYMQQELRIELNKKYSAEVANEEERKLIEDLDPIMNVTYGIAVYQEQLMFLVQAMAGFSLAEADMLRRWIWKKKKEVIEQLKKEFIKKWEIHRKYKPETSKFIYEKMIEPAASYSFNKSHSVCYSYIAYQTAYLKAHFPIEFYAALIRSVEEDPDEMSHYIYEAQAQGIELLSPNINESFNHIAVIDEKIRLWFLWIKWIWFDIWEFIQEERKKNWKFTNLEDFLKRCESIINKKTVESLAKSWAFDEFADRMTIFKNTEQVIERAKWSQTMSMWLFGGQEVANKLTFTKKYKTEMKDKMLMEYDVFKTFVSVHPLDGLYKHLKKFSFISQFINIENFWPFETIWYIKEIQRARKKWFFLKIEDASSQIEFFVKDILDLKKFDIIIIKGYKWRWVSLEKMTRTSREKLIKEAWNNYDPKMSITEVKRIRVWEDLKSLYANNEQLEKDKKIEIVKEKPWIKKEIIIEQKTNFSLPENIQKIKQILDIINKHKWNKKIKIWEKTFSVNEEAYNIIKEIL